MTTEEKLKLHWHALAKKWWREKENQVGHGAICDSCMAKISVGTGFYSPHIWRNELFCEKCAESRATTVTETIDQHTDPSCIKEYHDATSNLGHIHAAASDPEYHLELMKKDPKRHIDEFSKPWLRRALIFPESAGGNFGSSWLILAESCLLG